MAVRHGNVSDAGSGFIRMKMPVAVFRPRTRRQIVPMRMTVVNRRGPAHRMDMTGRVGGPAGNPRVDMIVTGVRRRQADKAVHVHSVRQKNHPDALYAPQRHVVTSKSAPLSCKRLGKIRPGLTTRSGYFWHARQYLCMAMAPQLCYSIRRLKTEARHA